MMSGLKRFVLVALLATVLVSQNAGAGWLPEEAVELLATRLDQSQAKEDSHAGVWGPELSLMGPAVGGMACAYQWTGDPDYWVSAELGGYYVLWIADIQGNLLGDEVYAFVRLSEASENPGENVWRSALDEWYISMRRPGYEGSTWDYIDYFEEIDPSTAVFYIAQHGVGAYYVDDIDKKVWRDALIKYLSRVDDDSSFPVMALGVATWAFGEMDVLEDATPVESYGAKAYWDGVTLRDLPTILAGHQVPEGEAFAGSFYWRLDHTSGGTGGVVSGYTEDSLYGTLGLVGSAASKRRAASSADDAGMLEIAAVVDDLDDRIVAAQTVLLEGIDEEGRVYEHLTLSGRDYHVYAGEMLEVLWSIEEYLTGAAETEAEIEVEVEVEAL